MMSRESFADRGHKPDDEKILEHRAHGEGGREDDDEDVPIELDGSGGQIDHDQDNPDGP